MPISTVGTYAQCVCGQYNMCICAFGVTQSVAGAQAVEWYPAVPAPGFCRSRVTDRRSASFLSSSMLTGPVDPVIVKSRKRRNEVASRSHIWETFHRATSSADVRNGNMVAVCGLI